MEQYAALQLNLQAMTRKQQNMMKLQEIRQKQHELDLQESKLHILNVAKGAGATQSIGSAGGDLNDTLGRGDEKEQT